MSSLKFSLKTQVKNISMYDTYGLIIINTLLYQISGCKFNNKYLMSKENLGKIRLTIYIYTIYKHFFLFY